MSLITEMVIYLPNSEDLAMSQLNRFSQEIDSVRHQVFELIPTGNAGGSKLFTGDIWAMAGNYYPVEDLINKIPSFSWTYPENFSLAYLTPEGETFMYRIPDQK
jgi:hypothetical protein